MTGDRSRAYGRVMRMLEELGPAKLLPAEVALVRECADTLLFCEDVAAPGAREAIEQVDGLCERLVEADRWTPERAADLRADIAACGPLTLA